MRLVRISQCASRRIAVASESTRRLPPETVRSLLFGRLGGGSSEKGGRQRQGPGAAVCVRARAGRRIWQRERPCVRVRVRVRWGRTVAINWSLEIDIKVAGRPRAPLRLQHWMCCAVRPSCSVVLLQVPR
jgi:hypothetical protein